MNAAFKVGKRLRINTNTGVSDKAEGKANAVSGTEAKNNERYVDIILLYAKPSVSSQPIQPPTLALPLRGRGQNIENGTDKVNTYSPRFCFVVSKKVSNKANKRNKIRRRLREIVRTELLKHPEALAKIQSKAIRAVLILAKPNILEATYEQLKSQVVESII